jgi:hypothetical protein
MAEYDTGSEQYDKKLTFASPEPMLNSVASTGLVFGLVILVVTIFVLAAARTTTAAMPASAGVFVFFLFFASIVYQFISRQWIAEINLTKRRIRIFRRSFGRWTKVIVDYPFDKCVSVGTIEYNNDGHISYGAYVQLANGGRHAIPLTKFSFDEAARVASQLSAATGIQRIDTKF